MDLTNFVVRVANSEEDKMPVVFENMLRHCAEEADVPKENVNSWIRDIWEMIKSRPNEVAAFAAPVAGAGLGAYVGRKWNPYLSALAGGSLGAAGGSVLDPSLGFALLADIVKRILPEEKKSNKEKKDSKEKKDNKEKDQKGASEKSSSAIEVDANKRKPGRRFEENLKGKNMIDDKYTPESAWLKAAKPVYDADGNLLVMTLNCQRK